MPHFKFNVFVCLLTFVMFGCGGGSSDAPDMGEVSGTITVDGKPGAGLMVTFQPESGRPSIGTTDDSGYYELDYTADLKGAKIGKGFITIVTPADEGEGYSEGDEEGGEGYAESTDPIPAKYNAEAASNPEMQVEIKAEGNTFDYKISTTE
ncbi:MAG: hypothetical protein HUJ26_12825 [Planctomycetaceae bacterium]|nr:hypothetical protein [Planctomycetaceae bacterium]